MRDAGKCGEYLIYRCLRSFEKRGGRFLFNIFIPKTGHEVTEIDMVLVGPFGVLVIESKNFSGWIFGHEAQKYWTQTLPVGRGRSHKEHFYNPIFQNDSHIRHLRLLVGQDVPLWSLIVFSDRCSFVNLNVNRPDVCVVRRRHVVSVVSKLWAREHDGVLSDAQIEALYEKLYPYTQVGREIREQHVRSVLKYKGG